MLRLRVATALVMGGAVIAAICLLPHTLIALGAALIGLAASWEWSRLARCTSRRARAGYLAAILGSGALAWWLGPVVVRLWLGVAIAVWVGIGGWLLAGGHPRVVVAGCATRWLVAGWMLLPPFAFAIAILVQQQGSWARALLVYAIGLVCVADIGAYFSGRAFGRHALAPRVSSGKTREGLIGGMVAVVLYAMVAAWLFDIAASAWLPWLAVALVAGLFSVVGDLLESVLKREASVKDSGRLLPGHGGLLDRIDGLIAAIPMLAAGLALVGVTGGP